MTVRVGVIGVGLIGEDHVRRLSSVVPGAAVAAVTDVDPARAAAVAKQYAVPAVHHSGEDVIADPAVDAVVVASWGPTHEQYVLAAIAAGKPVFCEKPLATTSEACERVLAAESALGRRLVQVGFMRRYDEAYVALRAAVADGSIGAPLLAHMAHRNPSVPPTVTSEAAINDSAVHEIDVTRWLLGEEIISVMVLAARHSSLAADSLQDPMVVLFRTESGVLVDDELALNVQYGYDIRAEVVGETGQARLPVPATAPPDWRVRFVDAYDTEFRAWIADVAAGREPSGPTAWDGYAATVVAGAAVSALDSGGWVKVALRERPELYRAPVPA
ncbi:MAG TPA: Gfo/Idh/MocA family oxidoreductase [Streptosporangiaceae bacterium]|nr:Gfo/Idh/MocA family oxidoreductase [Streptosporangiaceae bacterium]